MNGDKKRFEDLLAGPALSPAAVSPSLASPPVNLWQAVYGNYGTAMRFLANTEQPSIDNLARVLQIPEEVKKGEEGLKPKFLQKRSYTVTPKDSEIKVENILSIGGSFSASLVSGLGYGPLVALKSVKIESTGERKSEDIIPLSGSVLSALNTSLALEILKLKIERLGFSLDAGMTGKGSVKEHYGPEHGRTGELGAEAKTSLGYKAPTLRLWPLGDLKASATAEGTAGVTRSLGEPPGAMLSEKEKSDPTKPSAGFEAALRATFESLKIPVGIVTVRFVGDAYAKFSVATDPKESNRKAALGGSFGLELVLRNVKFTVKLLGDVQEIMAPKPGQKKSFNAQVTLEF